jgi:hypothetical protein
MAEPLSDRVISRPSRDEQEIATLAQKLGTAYREMVTFLQTQMHQSLEGAQANAIALPDRDPAAEHRDMLQTSPEQISWVRLNALAAHDAELAHDVWRYLKCRAIDELESGHRAAEPLEWDGHPWDRARFMALVESFSVEWQPRGGIELSLIDMLAQQYTAYLFWLGQLHTYSTLEVARQDPKLRRQGYYELPRLDSSQAMEHASMMVERFNRLFLRTLRALRDYRRYTGPPVLVQHAGQVNVAQQQVNVSAAHNHENA